MRRSGLTFVELLVAIAVVAVPAAVFLPAPRRRAETTTSPALFPVGGRSGRESPDACAPHAPRRDVDWLLATMPPGPTGGMLTIAADASLAVALRSIAGMFEHENPGTVCRCVCGSGPSMVALLQRGLKADVLATMSDEDMAAATALRVTQACVAFATDRACVVVPEGSRIADLRDLMPANTRGGVVAAPGPATGAARRVLADLSATAQPGIGRSAMLRLKCDVGDSGQVISRVKSGRADAGFVYRSDAVGAQRVRILNIPDSLNEIATCSVGIATEKAEDDLARRFVEVILSAGGQGVLRDRGFTSCDRRPQALTGSR